MPASPLENTDGPVTVEIKSNGSKIGDVVGVVSVSVRAEMMRIPEAVIVVEDGDPATGEFPVTDGSEFAPGAAITIAAGYGETVATIFEGVVVGMRLKIDGRSPRLIVTCRDKAVKMTLGHKSKVSANVTDSAAISGLIGDAGLTADVAATSATHPELVQHRATDWDFLLARAEASGMLAWAEGGKVSVKAPNYSTAPALKVTYGIDLLRFDAETDARSQLQSVEAAGWSLAQQVAVKATATTASGSGWGNLTGSTLAAVAAPAVTGIDSSAALDDATLDAVAKARIARAELARLRGQVRFQGNAAAKLGTMLELAGLGARFNGKGLVCSVVHRIEAGNWTTEAGLGLDPEWLTDRGGARARAAGLTLPAGGLQIGKVAKLTDDPDAQHRIQVKLPLVGADASVWARLGGPYCSNAAGVMFLPEINDEVIVGFFDDDPSHAVVLGSLHSSTIPPPVAAAATNHIKTILTPKKLKLELDDEKKKVTVATPGGNTLVLDDEAGTIELACKNGNKLTLASGGITLDSVGDVTIKAKKGVAVQATADVTIKGMNVTATGQAGFSASGNSSAEVKAAGMLKIQGSLVQIN
jgi:Rhs element Vgr protein